MHFLVCVFQGIINTVNIQHDDIYFSELWDVILLFAPHQRHSR